MFKEALSELTLFEIIDKINTAVNDVVWGVPALILIIGVGLYLSIRLHFVQIRKFGHAMKETLGKFFIKSEKKEGAVTPFQAVCTALAATIGTGSIAGVAGAIAIGGPGAIFWMWVSALLGMCTKFVEVTLAVKFREKNAKGDYVGGPMYFIKNGLSKKWRFLAYLFCVFAVFAVFGTGNATQVNTIVSSITTALTSLNVVDPSSTGKINLILGIALAIVVGVVLIGGIQRLGAVTEKLVPFMAIVYILLAIIAVIMNYKYIGSAFAAIFAGAFNPKAVTGGVVGGMFVAMKKGISRGVFSNEAGLGTASIAHSSTSETVPAKQGLFGVFEVFISTVIICTLTGLVIICGHHMDVPYGVDAGAELTIAGFTATFGSWVTVVTAVAMSCFAFSTVLGWGLYGVRCLEFMFGSKINIPFMVVFSLTCIVGATLDLGLIWKISDTFNGLMAIPNLIAVALLSPVAIKEIRAYFKEEKK